MPDKRSDSNSDPRYGHNRLHADANRAVGGVSNLVREIARISHRLEPAVSAEWMIKRVQFLSYDLQMLARHTTTDTERVLMLNDFFFSTQQFQCVNRSGDLRKASDAYQLNRVLVDRMGAPLVLEVLYSYLAEKIGVNLEFVDLKPTCFLKWRENGRSRFIDMTRRGAMLSADQLIETLHDRFRMPAINQTTVLEACSFESFISDYLHNLKRALSLDPAPNHLSHLQQEKATVLLFLQETLIAYQPSNLQLIGERAMLLDRMGNHKGALTDLKRYFAFHDRSRAPLELVELYDKLAPLCERNKSNLDSHD